MNLRTIRPKYLTIRGDTFVEELQLKDADGDLITDAGWTWRFTVRTSVPATSVVDDDDATISKSGSFTDGLATLTVPSTDMEIDAGEYLFDYQIRSPDGELNSTVYGDFIVDGDITRDTGDES